MSSPMVTNPAALTAEEYFNPSSMHFIVSEQVVPIIDLMAISNALFAKLRDFITLRLPPGFPVKIGERRRS
ncbi:hypothetical protein GOODEAATRI_025384 [Goodea atripinnis]|uniref:Ankyrin repeat domain-containing protein n=1 Tax=Goodea atripinnis TaxID=208336 RepID=A0ABV0P7P8_9TELE